jgi:L-ascorbate metabolism protein UlaG (beta-lactamase superfamily)
MKITYLAHASFLITAADGTRIITDPYDPSVGYRMPEESADIVTSSHDHFDHRAFQAVKGSFEKITSPGEHLVKGIHIRGVATAHDEEGGTKRGKNVLFVIDVDGIAAAHLGDLGHELTDGQIKEMGAIDVMLMPVGGHFTIGAKEAAAIVSRTSPRIVIPMHYKTSSITFPIAPVEDFAKLFNEVEYRNGAEIELKKESLPKPTSVIILEHSC